MSCAESGIGEVGNLRVRMTMCVRERQQWIGPLYSSEDESLKKAGAFSLAGGKGALLSRV